MPEKYSTKEIWRPVVGWEGQYAVSNMGRVMRTSRTRNGRASGTLLYQTKLMPRGSLTSYYWIRLFSPSIPRRHTRQYVHRLVAAAFIGDPNGLEINHLNGNGTDNRVVNLEICTRKQNILHSRRVLGRGRGEDHGHAKITEKTAGEVKRLLAIGIRQCDISRRLALKKSIVYRIACGECWAWLA